MGDRATKDALYDGFSVVAKALANGRRAEIVDVLSQGERSVEELATEIGQSVANTSQHLQQLAGAGLVRTRRDGNRVIYALTSPQVGRLWVTLRSVAADHVAQIDRLAAAYLGDRDGLPTISRDELARRLRSGDVVILDVRPVAEYRAGHILGARSVPITGLDTELDRLDDGQEVVTYCRGPYCVYADDAVRELRRRGVPARRLEDGYPEWADAGLPTAAA
jgi:rhodanese-related sulfurtransferase/DNA-binding MarR family transcriptional regulator